MSSSSAGDETCRAILDELKNTVWHIVQQDVQTIMHDSRNYCASVCSRCRMLVVSWWLPRCGHADHITSVLITSCPLAARSIVSVLSTSAFNGRRAPAHLAVSVVESAYRSSCRPGTPLVNSYILDAATTNTTFGLSLSDVIQTQLD